MFPHALFTGSGNKEAAKAATVDLLDVLAQQSQNCLIS